MKPIYIVVGVSGSGKSTFGSLLAEKLHLPFIEADTEKKQPDYLRTGSQYQVLFETMAFRLAQAQNTTGAVLACTALTNEDRTKLAAQLAEPPVFIYLQGDYETITSHLKEREGESFSPEMLADQFEILEEPEDAYIIPLEEQPNFLDEVDALIELQRLEQHGYHAKYTQTDNNSYDE
ncbi:MAG: AAA family ATPase [Spirochaetota bacterium]